jgi:peptidyl-prolyl cis-trans isomerase D
LAEKADSGKVRAMLGAIREKTQGIIATFIIALLIIPFAFWGVNSYFERASKVVVAEVNGKEIDEDAFRRAIDRYRNRVDPSMLDNPIFKRQVADNLVQRELLRGALEEEGYAVSAQQLGALIRNMAQFKVGDEFSMDRYQAALRAQGLTISQFEESVRQQKQLDQVVGGLKDSAIVSKADVDRALALQLQKRRVQVVTIAANKFLKTVRPDEEQIKTYYEQNKARYQEPERVRIEYISLSAAELKQAYKPTEEDLQAIYQEEKGRYSKPATRRVSHILLELAADAPEADRAKAEKLAKQIVADVRKGASFAALAKKYSNDPTTAKQGGDLGELSPGLLPPELEAAVNRLKKGEITEPVRTEYGYQIARLTAYTPAKTKPLSEVRDALVKILRERKGEERYYDMAERFNNLVYEQPDSLEPAAKTLGLKIHKSDWFTRTGGAGVARNPKVIDAAFSEEVKTERRNSESIEIGENSLLALRVTGVKAARQKDLVEVRASIVSALRQRKAEELTEELGREIVLAARKGKSMASLAQQHGVSYQAAQTIGREEKSLDSRLVSAMFAARRPENKTLVVDGIDLGIKGYAVFALSTVEQGQPDKADKKQREKITDQLEKRRGSDYFDNYLVGLRKSGEVKIYNDKL